MLVATLVVATAVGLVRRHRSGRLRAPAARPLALPVTADDVRAEVAASESDVLSPRLADALGVTEPAAVTLLQFSTAFCAPCRATRTLLHRVAGEVDGVRHVEVDAESHLDAVRRLHILRTPTVLVLDSAHRIVGRASGAPRRADVLDAVGAVLNRADGSPR